MSYIWALMILFSIIGAFFTGRVNELSSSIISSLDDTVEVFITIFTMTCLWSGLSKIAEKSELTKVVNKFLNPILVKLFPRLDKNSKAMTSISLNVTANLLGLGNAATPLGLKAMKELQEINSNPLRASDEMVTFLILNTSAIQLLPITIAALRQQQGSLNPMDVIVPIWICSILALAVGLITLKIMRWRDEKCKL